jgi:hypothetical protein
MDHRSFLQLVEQPGGVVVRWDFKPAEDKGRFCRQEELKKPVFRIRIHGIHKFLGLLDPDPDPCIIKQKKIRKTLTYTLLRLLFAFFLNNVNVPLKSNLQKNFQEKTSFLLVS